MQISVRRIEHDVVVIHEDGKHPRNTVLILSEKRIREIDTNCLRDLRMERADLKDCLYKGTR